MSSQDVGTTSATPEVPQPRIDTSKPHPARRYNYWIGGKDHFEADRASGDAIAAVFPTVRVGAIENRKFMNRAVKYLAAEAGIRQFLDIGTGIPAPDNTHEVAQAIAPTSRVVYVDNDPIVMAHARALLNSHPDGATAYVEADLREGVDILQRPEVTQTLDLTQPVALLLVAVLHFLTDNDDPDSIVAQFVDALPSGSYLVASHGTLDFVPPELAAMARASAGTGEHGTMAFRSRDEFSRFFAGLEFVVPGIVPVSDWRPESAEASRPTPAEVSVNCAVARIP